MCWTGRIEDKRIAEKDIQVFKVVRDIGNGKIKSECIGFIYKTKKLYTLRHWWGGKRKLKPDIRGKYVNINSGFHSYNPDKLFTVKQQDEHIISVYSKKGNNFTISYNETDIKKVKCIIPKGSEYWENKNGEVVSNQIMIL